MLVDKDGDLCDPCSQTRIETSDPWCEKSIMHILTIDKDGESKKNQLFYHSIMMKRLRV
jgi:hypothetical protein